MRFMQNIIFWAGLLTAGAVHSAMHLSEDREGEVLIFPFYSALGGDTTELKVTNSSGFVKGVKVRVREGLRGDVGLDWHVYLGPYDDFVFHIWKDPNGEGAVIKPASSESTCTVPSFDGYEQGVYMRNFEWLSDSFAGFERSLAGYVEVIEMGQWDPFVGEKGPAASRGASGSVSDCGVLIDAWSIIQGVDGAWKANKKSEALSWRGGGLSGTASVRISSQTLNYDAVALAEFARYEIAAEYHEDPGALSAYWPGANLNAGNQTFDQLVNGVSVRQSAVQGRDAVSALLSSTIFQSQAPANSSSTQSWILSFPTKHLHTESSSRLGPFSEAWNSSLSQSCDFVEVGSYIQASGEFDKAGETELCAAVNLVNTSPAGEAPVSFPYWLTTSPRPQTTPTPTALRAAYRSSTSTEVDRSVYVDSNYDSDTRIVGLPMIAIPIYFDSAGEVKSGYFSTATTRIYERLTVSLREVSYSSSSATIRLDVSNLSGFGATSYAVACEGDGEVVEASNTSASLTVSPLIAGERYLCKALAHTATGQGKTSDEFPIQIAIAPEPPLVSKTDFEEGTIFLYVTAEDNGSAITEFTATCTDGYSEFTSTSSTSPIVVEGLDSETAYTCSVTATNGVGESLPSGTTDPLVPELISAGLPIWLLYEASK